MQVILKKAEFQYFCCKSHDKTVSASASDTCLNKPITSLLVLIRRYFFWKNQGDYSSPKQKSFKNMFWCDFD